MQLRLGEVAEILGTSCPAPERVAQGYSIDSRQTLPGQLFFAIRGRRLDGHEFVRQALQQGAVGAVVERTFAGRAPKSVAPMLIAVRDTTESLQALARAVRRHWGKCVVGITGSTGKTTTKEMTAAILSRRLSVLKSPGNFNNDYGLPLALLALQPENDVAVVELAMSAAGEIARLARIAEPEIGVVTNVGPVHLQFFKSLDDIARAKRELIENLSAGNGPATAVLNHDDARVAAFVEGFSGRVVTYGSGEGSEFRASGVRPDAGGGTRFRATGPNLDAEFYLDLPGAYNVENALAAIATSSLFGISANDMGQALTAFKNLPKRSEILTLPGGITVLHDSYNSNPRAMERMLETLAGWRGARRRIVVAGEMLELGPSSPEWHRSIGRKCVDCGVDWLIAVQGDARFFLVGALEKGLDRERTRFFASSREAGEFCWTLLRSGDVALVKGSRGVGLEKVIELLRNSLSEAPVPSSQTSGERTE